MVILIFIVLRNLRFNIFSSSRDITRPHDRRNTRLGKWEPLNLSHDYAKFDAYRSCSSGDVKSLFCHVISDDHTIKETCDWVRMSSSTQLTTVQSLMVIGLVEVEIQHFFLSRSIMWVYDERSWRFGMWNSLNLSHHPTTFWCL